MSKKEQSPLIRPVQRTKSKSTIFRLFEKKPPVEDEDNFYHTGTTFSLDCFKTNRFGARQQRRVVLSEGGISNMKGKAVQWFYPFGDIHSIQVDPSNPKNIELRVIKNYHFETNDANEVEKIVNNFKEIQSKSTKKQVSVDDFEFIKMLGKGSFSKVCLVKHKETGRLLAMKVLTKSELARRNQVEHTNTEKFILSKYKHPFLVKMFYSFQSTDKLYMVLEYIDGGELFYHLKRAKRFPEDLTRFYAAEVLLVLEMLHNQDIIYRDLKPENILVGSDGHLKVADFGLAKTGVTGFGGLSDKGITTKTFCGTPDYLAPEMIQSVPHGKGVDFWAFGVLVYEMLSGQPPFFGNNRNELYECTLKGQIIFADYITDTAKDLIKSLLNTKPENRLGFDGVEDVKKHAFFKGIDWDKLLRKEIDPPYKPFMSKVNTDQKMDSETLKEILPNQDLKTNTIVDKTGYKDFTFVSENILDGDVKTLDEKDFKL